MRILLFANADWYLYNFRLPLANQLKRQGHDVVLVAPAGDYMPRLKQAGFRCISLPLSRWGINPLHEAYTLLQILRLYQREKPDVVHHFTVKCVIYGSIAAKITKVKSVINAITGLGHVFTDESRLGRYLKPLVKCSYCLALSNSTVVFQNADDRQTFVANGLVKPENTALIRGSGVDIQYFFPRPKPATRRPICVLFIARLLWSKGLGEFMEAARVMTGSGKSLLFKVAGAPEPGNPATVSEAELARWQEQGQVEFLGHQPNIKDVLAEADIVVLPSYREGLPRVLLEAAACGLPLVATDVPGCREIVQHGYNGFLVPVKDSAGLVRAIERLAANDYLRLAMGKQSRQLVCQEFSEQQVLRKTISLYGTYPPLGPGKESGSSARARL